MRIAFYAPMKSPSSTQPSGDRTIGRLLMTALCRSGADVRLVSCLRTWSAHGGDARLDAITRASQTEAAALVATYNEPGADWRPDLWFTYHSYYKAPDLLGPEVARSLGLPYVLAEGSYAARRNAGQWCNWLDATRSGLVEADAIFCFTKRDKDGLKAICDPDRLIDLAPFLDLDLFEPRAQRPRHAGPGEPLRLVTVAMMRDGDKFESYKLLAESLWMLGDCSWHLDIVGDGEARGAVADALAAVPGDRIALHGVLDGDAVRAMLACCDVFVWPGIGEAFGMAYLEAQASGLPVVALNTAGVPEVVGHGVSGLLADAPTPAALAACLKQLLGNDDLRLRLSTGARSMVERRHSIDAASRTLSCTLSRLIARK